MFGNRLADRLGEFYRAHRQELYIYALSIVSSPACAEDAVAEAVASVLERRATPRDLRPYLFRCVRNAALDCLRREGREREKLSNYAYLFDERNEPGAPEAVGEWLACLAENEREWVVLKIFGGLTFREIGEVCGLPQGTVASGYWRGLKKLRAVLDSETARENQG